MRRRRVLQIGTGLATTSLIGSTSALAQPQSNGNGKGRPSVTATSDECEQITLTRNATGPNKPVDVSATRSDGSAETTQAIGRGESVTIDVEPGEWEIESGHPAVVAETSTVTVEECEPEGPTLTVTSPRCGVLALERNDVGEEFTSVHIIRDRSTGDYYHYDTAIARGTRREFGPGPGTYTIQVDDFGGDVELIGSPVTVEPCE